MLRRATLLALLCACACDAPRTTELRSGEPVSLQQPVRRNPAPPVECADYGNDPGFSLTVAGVLIPDYCMGTVSNLDTCQVSTHEEPNGVELDGPDIEIWCVFECPDDQLPVVSLLLSYPDGDEPVEHYTIGNPCP